MAMPNNNGWLNDCYCIRDFSERNSDTTWKSAYIKHYETAWLKDRYFSDKPAPYNTIYPFKNEDMGSSFSKPQCYDTCISKEASGATTQDDEPIDNKGTCSCQFGSNLWARVDTSKTITLVDGEKYWRPNTELEV